MSMQIQRLEAVVGRPLFDRSSHHVTPTSQGETFLAYARHILEIGREAIRALEDAAPPEKLRLGCVEDWMSRRLPRELSAFTKDNPAVAIEITTGSTAELALRLGTDLDLMIGLAEGGAQGRQVLIERDQLVWAMSAAAASSPLPDPLPLALHPTGCLYRKSALRTLDDHRLRWSATVTSPGLGALEAIVAEGLAIAPLLRSALPAGLREVENGSLPSLPIIDIVAIIAKGAPLPARRFLAGLERRRKPSPR